MKKVYKLFIIPIILISFFITNVNAATFNNMTLTDDVDNNGGSWVANNSGYYFVNNGYRTIDFETDIVGNLVESLEYQYGFISYCSYDNIYQTYRQNSLYSEEMQMFDTYVKSSIYGSSIPCTIRYITWKFKYDCGASGTYCNAHPRFKFYGDVSDYTLRSYGFTKEPLQIDSTTGQILNQNATIIDQNNQIINKTDEIKGTITSDDDDTTSSKCGILCKLKGIFNGITNLPSKIGDLLKSLFIPTNDQLYEIVNDSKELSENFGFVGQSVNYFVTMFSNLVGLVTSNGCVEFPGFKISKTTLFDEHVFWEARNVCLSDNVILSENITQIRFITSTVLICLFISFASDMFFKILSKNESYRTSADVDSIGGAQ